MSVRDDVHAVVAALAVCSRERCELWTGLVHQLPDDDVEVGFIARDDMQEKAVLGNLNGVTGTAGLQ